MVYCHHIMIISPAFCSHFHSVCRPRPSRWGCRSIHPAYPTSARKIGRFLLEFCHYWHQYPAKKLVRLMLSAFDCSTDVIIYIYTVYTIYMCVCDIYVCVLFDMFTKSIFRYYTTFWFPGRRSLTTRKKNGSLNSEWCLEEQFNAELLAENIDCTVEFIERSRFSQNCTCEPVSMRNQLWMWLAKIGLAASAMIIFLFLMQ